MEFNTNSRPNRIPVKGEVKYHYWLSYTHGFAISTDKKCPSKHKGYRYMGFSSDKTWPKKMSTGRILHAQVK